MTTDLDDDDGPFEHEDLLWLVSEMRTSTPTLDDLAADLKKRKIPLATKDLARLVSQAQAGGWLEIWKADGQAYIMLTPLSAQKLDVQLSIDSARWERSTPFPAREHALLETPYSLDAVAEGDDGGYGWDEGYRPGDERRGRRRPPRRDQVDRSVYFDPTCPEPLDVLVAAEAKGDVLRDGSHVIAYHILGIRGQWPEATRPEVVMVPCDGFNLVVDVCHGCLNEKLPRASYCAICHRSGVDGKFPPIERHLQQDGTRTMPHYGRLRGGKGA